MKAKQIKTKIQMVTDILTIHPETRDNDRLLIAHVWEHEQPTLFKYDRSSIFILMFVEGRLSFPDDITRARRKIQAEQSHLRGVKWKQHQRMVNEADVREHINDDIKPIDVKAKKLHIKGLFYDGILDMFS